MVYFVMLANMVSDKLKAKSERGATMVEYGLMLALIAVVCILAVTAVGANANNIFNAVKDKLVVPAP